MSERVSREDLRLTPHAPLLHGLADGDGLEDLHELRVRIPLDLHRQLLSLKVLRGKSLAQTVSLALDMYFAQAKELAADKDKN